MGEGLSGYSAGALRVIHLAVMAATVVYVGVGYVVVEGNTAGPLPRGLTLVLVVAAVVSLALAYVAPRSMWRDRATYGTGMIIHWACLESVAIYGLVLTVISGHWLPALVGAVVSLAFLASARPRSES